MPIGGRPFLDYLLSAIADAGIRRVGLVVAPAHEAARRTTTGWTRRRCVSRSASSSSPNRAAPRTRCWRLKPWTGGEPFLVMNGDNLYPADVLRDLAALDEPGLPGFHRDDLVRSSNIPDHRVASFALIETDDAAT